MNNIILDISGKFKMHGDGAYTLDNMFDTLKIKITENDFRTPMDLTSYTPKMAYVDKDRVGDIVDVTIKNAENGEVEFIIDNRFTAIPGVKYCQILLIKGEEKKHLAVFKLEVREGVFLNAYEEAYKDKKFEEFLESIDKIDELLSKTEVADNQIKNLNDKTSKLEVATNKNKADISDINNKYTNLTNRLSATEENVNTIKTKVDGLNVGMLNLARNTNVEITSGRKTNMAIDEDEIKKMIGKEITVSVDIDIDSAVSSTNNGKVGSEFTITYADDSFQYIGAWESINTTPKTVKKRISTTNRIKNMEIKTVGQLGIYIQNVTSGSTKVGFPKVGAGNVVTSWSPALEDTQKQITQNKNNITAANEKHTALANIVTKIDKKASDNTENIEVDRIKIENLTTKVSNINNKVDDNSDDIQRIYEMLPGEDGSPSELANKVDANFRELEGLKGGYETANARIEADIARVSDSISKLTTIMEGTYIKSWDSVAGVSGDIVVEGNTLINIYEPLGEWDNQETYAFIKINRHRFKPNTKYTIYIEDMNYKIEKINLGAYDEERYLPDTVGKFAKFSTGAIIHDADTYIRVYSFSEFLLKKSDLDNMKILILEGEYTKPFKYFKSMEWSGKGTNEFTLSSSNKNLTPKKIKLNTFVNCTATQRGDSVIIKPTTEEASEVSCCSQYFTLEPEKKYTVSYEGNEDVLKVEVFSKRTKWENTFTTNKLDFEIFLKFYCRTDKRDAIAELKVQVEERDEKTYYAPPISQEIKVSVDEIGGLKSVPLARDEITKDYSIKRTESIIISSDGWVHSDTYEKCMIFNNPNYNGVIPDTTDGSMLCNRMRHLHSWDDVYHFHKNPNMGLVFTIPKDLLPTQDLNGFMNWFNKEEIQIIYKLDKPVVKENKINKAINLYDGFTQINESTIANPIIKIPLKVKSENIYSAIQNDRKVLTAGNHKLRDSLVSVLHFLKRTYATTLDLSGDYSVNIFDFESIIRELEDI